MCQPISDLSVLRAAHQKRDGNLCDNIAFNEMFMPKHNFVFRFIDSKKKGPWVVPLGSFPDSAVILCKVDLVKSVGSQWEFSKCIQVEEESLLAPVFALADIEVVQVRWRSPAWIQAAIHRPVTHKEFGIVLEKIGEPTKLINVACRQVIGFLLLLGWLLDIDR